MNISEKDGGARRGRFRALLQPLIALAAMAALSYIVYVFDIPNPNIILMVGMTFFTVVFGLGAGIASALVMIAYSMYFFSEGNNWVTFTPVNLEKLVVVILGAAANVAMIGILKHRKLEADRRLAEVNRLLRADNQSLEEASLTDALTGARNRFGLRRDYSLFENRSVHVMMLDLDDFKRSNDTYGHAVGDYILKKAGRLLTDAFGADSCYRYGGDEFLVICRDMDEAAFVDRLNTLKQGVNTIYLNDKRLPACFSAGYVHGVCEQSEDLRLMMHQADSLLYQAKEKGRNQWAGGSYSREKARSIVQSARGRESRAANLSEWWGI